MSTVDNVYPVKGFEGRDGDRVYLGGLLVVQRSFSLPGALPARDRVLRLGGKFLASMSKTKKLVLNTY